jgi:hypothetical protein
MVKELYMSCKFELCLDFIPQHTNWHLRVYVDRLQLYMINFTSCSEASVIRL